jgi:hypothetical protein
MSKWMYGYRRLKKENEELKERIEQLEKMIE